MVFPDRSAAPTLTPIRPINAPTRTIAILAHPIPTIIITIIIIVASAVAPLQESSSQLFSALHFGLSVLSDREDLEP